MTRATIHPLAANRRGMTLVELLVSLFISSIVLTAAAALAFAVGQCWSKSEDVNDVVNHGRHGVLRIGDRVRGGLAIGFADATRLVLWREDANGDGQINLGELTLFYLEPADQRLSEGQFVFPADISSGQLDANNGVVTAAQFVEPAVVNQLRNNGYFSSGPVAEHVQSASWQLDTAPPATRMVQVQLRLSKDGLSQMLCAGATLRAPREVE